ncbi:MAG: Coenzyme F420 hydrogenase/dehydrogenase, beta subunit C-terminal domain [Bacteroidales bacterium]|nr:Coenzyme F420 hydrogenase/dehydrogenase, beta subunit C-terminal domain [Bacteroidales bacterium]
MNPKANIIETVINHLCHSCGACSGVCPTDAIGFYETIAGHIFPEVNEEQCIHCGLCLDVCSGQHFNNTLMHNLPEDPFTGNVNNAWIGKATDPAIFENGQSGGVVTAILARAFQSEKINTALVVGMDEGNPPRPSVRIARSPIQLIKSQKSKYAPVPLLSALRILKYEDFPVAIVGVSCQIHSLYNIFDKVSGFSQNVAFAIGLVCDRVMTMAAIDYLAEDFSKEMPYQFHYRDKKAGGYPGNIHLIATDGKSKIKPAKQRMLIKDYFTPARCRICFDKMNIFSDITVGDPNGINDADNTNGESVVICRTDKGRHLIEEAIKSNIVKLKQIDYEKIIAGQKINRKRMDWNAYAEVWKKNGNKIPDYLDRVKHETIFDIKNYKKSIYYSLKLDEFQTRSDLLLFVRKALKKKRNRDLLKLPVKMIRKLAKNA